MVNTNPEVEDWFMNLTEAQRVIAEDLRDIVLSRGVGLRLEQKWKQPCFVGKGVVCYLQKAKAHVALGFGQGAKLDDPLGKLAGDGQQMRHLKFPFGGEIDRSYVTGLIDQALRLDAGKL